MYLLFLCPSCLSSSQKSGVEVLGERNERKEDKTGYVLKVERKHCYPSLDKKVVVDELRKKAVSNSLVSLIEWVL